ncbi:hypothetical protein BV898_16639 [Hypsibius exemplaris]|uniref:Uncharacterized protein n=1 Tax=Hypsibius exemplaris TaxID=2072580 RepID=A0A9X6NE49_HYPEX|nr:hypothetical protein BV898_16639 [Hypsibius exemplaris]
MCVYAVFTYSLQTASIIPSSPGEEAATSARKVRIDPLETLTKLYFINHTRCECRAAADALRPQHPAFTATDSHPREPAAATTIATSPCRRCPEPFAVRRINTTCHCDCFDGQTDCLHVKRGRKPLDGAETKCVAKKDCSPPTCGEGQFDVQTGYCPKSHKRHKPKKAAELTQQAPAHSMSTSLSANSNSSLVLSPIFSSRFHGSDRLRQH